MGLLDEVLCEDIRSCRSTPRQINRRIFFTVNCGNTAQVEPQNVDKKDWELLGRPGERMNVIPPLANILAASPAAQRLSSDERNRQARRAELLRRNSAARSDLFEHVVENSEEATPVHEDQSGNKQKRRPPQKKKDPPHNLDLRG